MVFQSTHPLRGATNVRILLEPNIHHFNPRTPCGVRRVVTEAYDANVGISIHAPLAGCDATAVGTITDEREFQSTHPLRGAT